MHGGGSKWRAKYHVCSLFPRSKLSALDVLPQRSSRKADEPEHDCVGQASGIAKLLCMPGSSTKTNSISAFLLSSAMYCMIVSTFLQICALQIGAAPLAEL